jgi:Trypsin
MLQRLLTAARLLPLVACVACGGGTPEESSEAQQAIIGGEPSPPTQDAVVAVKAPTSPGEMSGCTGTLIAPNLVATALHCVAFYTAGSFSCNPDGTLGTQRPGDGAIGEVVVAQQVEIRTGADAMALPDASALGIAVLGTGTTQICRGDLAVVVLDRELELPIAPIRLSRLPEVGEPVEAAGYGATGGDSTPGRSRRGGLFVSDVGPSGAPEPKATAAPGTFVVGEGPCYGDSGGPAFDETTGALLGVFSLVAGSSCTALGVRNVYTTLASFSDVILDGFELAGATPTFEPEPGAGGEGGGGGSDSSGGAAGAPEPPTGDAGEPSDEPGVDPNAGSGSRDVGSCACSFRADRRPLYLAGPALLALLALRRRAR